MPKTIIYQLLPRLFGNGQELLLQGGSIEQNGCGHLEDITAPILRRLRAAGVTDVWYTGLLAHATRTDYTRYGLPRDHAAIVKGRAGSPYAVKDYYDIDPDLTTDPERRMEEMDALVERTHRAGLRFIMDFVPNHVARQYRSLHKPAGIADLGEGDNTSQAFSPQNNFYYMPGQDFRPDFDLSAGEPSPYHEAPAKATGNDCFTPVPSRNDWYETVKLNYGIDYTGGHTEHFHPTPSTWHKMLHILLFWAGRGVDGFRCDMAEMVPCAFWAWAIAKVKQAYPHVTFIAEVYQPARYRDYIHRGGFDLLYDKVGLYDTLRAVSCHQRPASDITHCWQAVDDIQQHMLYFLENHDEQRIASDYFLGDGRKGRAALVTALCMNTNPMMLYFGQALGERGMDQEGFSGRDGRTTIFDYWSLSTIRAWCAAGCKVSALPAESRALLTYYNKVMRIAQTERAISEGKFFDLMYVNNDVARFSPARHYAFIRHIAGEAIIIIVNFGDSDEEVDLRIPRHAFDCVGLPTCTRIEARDLLSGRRQALCLMPDACITATTPARSAAMVKVTF